MAATPQTSPPQPTGDSASERRRGIRATLNGFLERSQSESWIDLFFLPVVLILLVAFFGIITDGFLNSTNLSTIAVQASILAIVAFGMTYLLLAAELDLSVGAGVALVSVVAALVMRDSGSVALGVLAGVGAGTAMGLFNGVVVTKLRVPSFIATLGMLVIAQGVALALTNGAVIGMLPPEINNLSADKFLGIRWLVWLTIAVFVVLALLQTRTSFGVKVMALGGNTEAARLSGINVDRIRLLCFVIVGICVGIAGIGLTSRVESGQPNAGGLLALTSIAAVVVGGTSILGGRGSVYRTLGGVLLIAVLDNGLDVAAVNSDLKQVIIGAVFIAAASVDFFRRRLQSKAEEERVVAEVVAAAKARQAATGS
ncbi:MAG: ABC transporter permease [Solirubrobacterales bacterium]